MIKGKGGGVIQKAIEAFFYNYGSMVAKHPWKTIGACVLLTVLLGLGLLKFTQENTGIKLWIPRDSSQR